MGVGGERGNRPVQADLKAAAESEAVYGCYDRFPFAHPLRNTCEATRWVTTESDLISSSALS
jgi:hypothetical protein